MTNAEFSKASLAILPKNTKSPDELQDSKCHMRRRTYAFIPSLIMHYSVMSLQLTFFSFAKYGTT